MTTILLSRSNFYPVPEADYIFGLKNTQCRMQKLHFNAKLVLKFECNRKYILLTESMSQNQNRLKVSKRLSSQLIMIN